MENGCASTEIERLEAEFRAFAQGSSSIGKWLSAPMDAGWEMAKALLEFSELADLLAELHDHPPTGRRQRSRTWLA